MPTAEDNGVEPEAQSPTTEDNAQELDVSSLTPEQLEEHPHVQELKKKYAATREGMDKSNVSKKELQSEVARLKVLAGEKESEEEATEEPSSVTREELKEEIWRLQHAEDIKVYGDEQYEEDIENGIPKDYALQNAKLRHQSNSNQANLDRQREMASGAATSTRDLEDVELTEIERKGIESGLYSKETALEFRKLKASRAK